METNKDLKVEAVKSFSVPVEKLYAAWTAGEQLKQWWKPMGNSLKEVINDLTPGGTVKYIFENNALVISGEYSEVKPNEKLAYSWNWELPADPVKNAEYKLTIGFSTKDTGSEIHVLQENFEKEEALQPHQDGWEKGLDDLESFLSGGHGDSTNSKDKGEQPGYREAPEQVKVGGAE